MSWVVPGDPKELEFDTRDAALARAWELTPAGGRRREPVEWVDKKTVASGGDVDAVVSVTNPEVHHLTWVYHLTSDEVFRPAITRKGLDTLSTVALGKGWRVLRGTFRYNVDGRKVTFYADAVVELWVRGMIIVNAAGEEVIYDGEQWTLLDSARGREIVDEIRVGREEEKAAKMRERYGMISDE
jgi:hypothetical protein